MAQEILKIGKDPPRRHEMTRMRNKGRRFASGSCVLTFWAAGIMNVLLYFAKLLFGNPRGKGFIE